VEGRIESQLGGLLAELVRELLGVSMEGFHKITVSCRTAAGNYGLFNAALTWIPNPASIHRWLNVSKPPATLLHG
jgi:hypothetical protein